MPSPLQQQPRHSLTSLLPTVVPSKRRWRSCAWAAAAVAAVVPLLALLHVGAALLGRQHELGAAAVVAQQRGAHGVQLASSSLLSSTAAAANGGSSSHVVCKQLAAPPLVPPSGGGLQSVAQLGEVLQREGLTTGAELGMHLGRTAAELLGSWAACRRYYLVYAAGATQPSSKPELSMHPQHQQQARALSLAGEALAPFASKLVWMHEWTSAAAVDAAALIQHPLDFVYVNPAFDVCSLLADVRAWWEQLRPGGIMAGAPLLRAASIALKQRGHQQQQQRARLACGGVDITSPAAAQEQLEAFFTGQGVQVVHATNGTSAAAAAGASVDSGNSTAAAVAPAWRIWLVRKPRFSCGSGSSTPAGAAGVSSRPAVHVDPLGHLLSHMQSQQQPGQQQLPEQQQPEEQQRESPVVVEQQLRRLRDLAARHGTRDHHM